MYRVRVFIVRDASEHLITHDGLMFEVHDVERSVAYYGRWVGAVRPRLAWRTEVLPSRNPAAETDAGEVLYSGGTHNNNSLPS